MHLNTYSRFRFHVLLITWQHSEVEHNFKSTVVITSIWITKIHCLTFIHRRHIFDYPLISSPIALRQVVCIRWSLVRKRSPFTVTWETLDAEMEDGLWPWRLTAQRYMSYASPHFCDIDINFLISVFRKLFITILTSGATESHSTLRGQGLGLIHKKPSCQPTGTHPSPRSASVWRSATNYGSLLSTSTPVRCTLWSLTGDTAPPHWVVTSGRRWLVHRPPYSPTVTRKGLMLSAAVNDVLKQELVSPVMKTTIVTRVTPGSGLALGESPITAVHVGMRLLIHQTMETSTSWPWVTSWFSNKS